MKILNLGCGHMTIPGWINVDIESSFPDVVRMNFLDGIDYSDDTFDAVYMSHVLEHIPVNQVLSVLRDIRRVLKLGGILRVVVPDFEEMAQAYLSELREQRRTGVHSWRREWLMLEIFDQMVRTQSGGLMKAWYQEIAPRSQAMADYVYERVGQEITCNGAEIKLQDSVIYKLNFDQNLQPSKIFRRLNSQLPKGEKHYWLWDELSLKDISKIAGFETAEKLTAFTSKYDKLFNCVDIDPSGNPRKGSSSIYMEFKA